MSRNEISISNDLTSEALSTTNESEAISSPVPQSIQKIKTHKETIFTNSVRGSLKIKVKKREKERSFKVNKQRK